jgi:phosphate transport system substrate-binding protein
MMNTKNILVIVVVTILLNGCFSTRFPATDDTPRLSENDFDISLYRPFESDGKVATLDTLSTLKLKTKLPILDGATALYPLYSAFVQAVYPKQNYKSGHSQVMCNNTMLAYNSLIKKDVDIIFVAGVRQNSLF